jgi:hypothetical protein
MSKKPKWNESPCPECKEPVSVEANRCPHCQAGYSSGVIYARKKANADSQKWGIGCVALIAMLILGMCSFGGGNGSKSDETTAETPAPKAGSAPPETTSAVKKLNDDIMAAVKPCDEAGKSLAEIGGGLGNGRASVYDGYSAASNVESACRSSWSEVGKIEVSPVLTGPAKTKAEEALETCENAMIAKQMGGEAMKEVFDGDMRPSKMNEAKEKTSIAQAGTIACVAGIFATAAQAGVELGKVTN